MNKLLLIIIGLSVISCTEKTVSLQYYKTHLDEAVVQNKKCAMDNDTNATNCENAQAAIQEEKSRIQHQNEHENLVRKTQNINDAFH